MSVTTMSSQQAPTSSDADLANHRDEIKKLMQKPLQAGDIWYLIDVHWFQQWQKFTGYDSGNPDHKLLGANIDNPGPIDNSSLLERNFQTGEYHLKRGLNEELDFVFVPEEAWVMLRDRFNLIAPHHEVKRNVIESGMFVKQAKIEVYPLWLESCLVKNESNKMKLEISRKHNLEGLLSELKKLFDLAANQNLRLFIKHDDNNYEKVSCALDTSLQDTGLYDNQLLLVDVQNVDGSWNIEEKRSSSVGIDPSQTLIQTSQPKSSGLGASGFRSSPNFNSFESSSSSSSYLSSSYVRKNETPGLCGLSNLGNTCFMNSALQCMSNTSPLTEYLVSGRYESEINDTNPLGMRGEMAKAFADLIKQIWSTKSGAVIPRAFKTTVGRFAPQFSGYQQQDSQELLAFLLDGLHEDLNRVRKKPYVELKDNDGKSDSEAAAEAWANYKLRNDSIVVDLFHALLKSTLVCPKCAKVSVTFDPFCYLSLPLPMKKERNMTVTFVPLNKDESLRKCKVIVPKNGVVQDLVDGLSRLIGKSSDQIVLADVYMNRFHKIFTPNESLTSIMERDDVFAYEIENFPPNERPISVRVYNRLSKKQPMMNFSSSTPLVGLPMVVMMKKDQLNYNGLLCAAKCAVSRFVDWPTDDEVWYQNENENDSGVDDNDDSNNGDDVSQRTHSSPGTGDASPEMFRMVLTNSFGTSELNQVGPEHEVPFGENNDLYLCLEWHPLAEKFFINDGGPVENDESMAPTKTNKKNMQLNECLDLFTTTEKLGEHDLWYCPGCKEHQQATKKFDLWSVPDILIIHLKRFSYSRIFRDKIEGLVEFPIEGLDVSPWIIGDKSAGTVYDLIAVSNHFGGLGGGHYTAFAKNKFTNHWYVFDDSSVSVIDQSEVVTKAAYVLIYARRQKTVQCESDPNVEMEDVEN